ncbi:MAG: hypothetical protein N3B16_08315 [Candidatus Aminicenantes bacterium]|nr:hypothetical protein [Candidatus Aminicenantes bacterium]
MKKPWVGSTPTLSRHPCSLYIKNIKLFPAGVPKKSLLSKVVQAFRNRDVSLGISRISIQAVDE